ncbi:HvfB family MNIO-type RiPP peptide maturase [Pseudohalioglobus sediminis]
MPMQDAGFHGAGLGLRRALLGPMLDMDQGAVDFLELAPENWIGVGGRFGRQLRQMAERYPIVLHGLSLDIGGPDPLDMELVSAVRAFMTEFNVPLYSEHLTYCAAEGHLYDLLPIPFTEEAVDYVVARIVQVQDIIGAPIALENASYYAQPHQDMTEAAFINAVLDGSGCDLLLDVNNIYVNSINHGYDPITFMESLPLQRARYIHVAGHYDEAEDLKVDTHGADVIDPVWQLLAQAYQRVGNLPTLLERDFNLPPLTDLLQEVEQVRALQGHAQATGVASGGGS